MKYTVIKVKCEEELSEVLQAILGNVGFDAFLENETGFEASIESTLYQEEEVNEALSFFDDQMTYSIEEQEKQNWNKLWESHYNPVEISEDLQIRASFHEKDPKYKYEIIITPKMSFGTGHHATTTLMLRNQLSIDHSGKNVADLGCGTGILAVMAKILGAKQVDACDIEDWSCENALENAKLNNVDIRVTVGTVSEMEKLDKYEIVLANINRNVLLEEMSTYQSLITDGGHLLLSGFYSEDLPIIKERAAEFGLTYASHLEKDNWISAVFKN
ncbi:50S ribosomal protein L11 methyltransferase [Flammeovirga yaeyamensis]|uniref:Ribosomal protein L11 methyltransferase n=1 Tax=Flammeovirga yaeyamensis TaxID=367791 RepID=A0AAX1N456_9BACT|nr:50S ribosomal protein L11 methyltransferase [Flammeovirga yaeyamensis]MBB3699772.1 ribosomal protein L11 methyltransferase [Flammeovirga yaeyamensis]NMF36659.1 50S ribosomal protein L11 methyltransferase [Flammeovirga yaeyamensis]QWG02296.1 50S ribosomal protein L11 methyltransferase [Flammeovirga yaeyamensis]